MNGIVTRHYLRLRFWIATAVLLATIAASAGIMILMAAAQADRGNYFVAFHHLNNATITLERELARLSVVPEGQVADRREARGAFVALLTAFRAISASALDQSEASAPGAADSQAIHHLADLAAEFGVDTAAAMERLRIGARSMPGAIYQVWEWDNFASPATLPMVLENALARLLRLVAPLVRGEGRFSSAERRRLREVENLAYGIIQPALSRVEKALDAEGDRIADLSVIFVLALTGFGFAAVLFNLFAIFRPLERAVMANQAEILAERDKAVAARNAKRNFLSMVSHELRTPMNGVLGFASLLAASDLKPGQRKQVEIIQSSGKTLLSLVDDILDFTKLEAGSLDLGDEEFSIEEVVSGVVTLLRGAALEKGLEMSVCIDTRLPARSRGDANRLRQVLTNLVGNAIKFTDSGTIGVEAREIFASPDPRGGCELELAVSDTGIGIAPGKKELIFERFTQIDTSIRRKFGGTGLGLAISKQLVDRMGGRIWVESTPGAGSTFFVHVPLAAALPAIASKWRTGAVAVLSGRRALVVDFHAINRRLIRRQLESYGLRVDDAADAAGGWALLEQAAGARDPYGAAILDHAMGDDGGVALARRIRADRRFDALRLLLNSPAGTPDLAEARNLGFDAVEAQPLPPRALIGALLGLIGDDPNAAGATAEISPGEAGEVRILLVEDSLVCQRLVQGLLSHSRYRVDTVADGLEAVRAVAGRPYDLILMDIRMPVTGGVEAARRIRALGGGAGRTPIIALTANVAGEDVADYRAAGMQDVVAKPIDRDILLAAIDAAIDAALDVAEGPEEEPVPQAMAE